MLTLPEFSPFRKDLGSTKGDRKAFWDSRVP